MVFGRNARRDRLPKGAMPAILITVLAMMLAPLIGGCASQAGAPDPTTFPASLAAHGSATPAPTVSAVAPAQSAAASPSAATPIQTEFPIVGDGEATAGGGVTPPTFSAAGYSVTISAVGDISLAREVVDRMETNGAAYPYALVAPLIDGEIGFANLEGALTDRGEAWPKGYNFRTPPRFAPGLRAGRISVVTLANNHTLDYGAIGLTDTIGALDGASVRHVGAGASDADAWSATIVETRGLRVAFVGCALTPDEGSGFSIQAWAASPATPGIAICEPLRLQKAVAAARQRADFVVVAAHAGDEYIATPNDTQRELATAALDAGADAYVGAHAHVVQPVEQRGGQLIAWGLGNFVFDLDAVDLANIPAPRVSVILDITLTKGQGVTAYHAIAVTQDADEDRPRPSTPGEAAALERMIRG